MPLLLDDDYSKLAERGITHEESEPQRFFIFTNYCLPSGMYTAERCDVLVIIPPNYNQAGNDMFWISPGISRVDRTAIPAIGYAGFSDNRTWRSREFHRWSRHWNPPHPGVWRPGRDDIISIYRRIDWALKHPGSQ